MCEALWKAYPYTPLIVIKLKDQKIFYIRMLELEN